MHEFVSFNHQISPASKVKISAISMSALYGKGVFTTLYLQDGTPHLWNKHWKRLTKDAETLGVDLSQFDQDSVGASIDELIEKNKVISGHARITFFDEKSGGMWPARIGDGTSLLIQTKERSELIDEEIFSMTISDYPISSKSPLAGIKSCNYLESLIAIEDAKRKGFSEAIRLNERGELVSACMANVFWISGDNLYTPSLKTGCRPGAMREYLIETEENVLEVEEPIEALKEADHVFLTSSGFCIREVTRLNDRTLVTLKDNVSYQSAKKPKLSIRKMLGNRPSTA